MIGPGFASNTGIRMAEPLQTQTSMETESHYSQLATVFDKLSHIGTAQAFLPQVPMAQLAPAGFTSIAISSTNAGDLKNEIMMGQEVAVVPVDLPLLDEAMDDLQEDFMDVDLALTDARMDLDLDADSNERGCSEMVLDPCSFDEFVQYFAVVLSPSSWMDMDPWGWGRCQCL